LTKQPGSDNEGTRVAAIKELIDRGYGKATQPITGEDGGPLALMVFTGVPHAQEEH
jgi:ABC-type xylose transport system substrate-binding protein